MKPTQVSTEKLLACVAFVLIAGSGIGASYTFGDPVDKSGVDSKLTDITATVSIERTGSTTVEYRIQVSVSDDVDSFSVLLRNRTAVSRATGFERIPHSPGLTRYNFTATDTATIIVEQDLETSAATGMHVLVADSWLLSRVPYVGFSWSTAAAESRRTSLFQEHGTQSVTTQNVIVGNTGFVENKYLYIGQYRRHASTLTETRNCEVLVPSSISSRAGSHCAAIQSASRHLKPMAVAANESTRSVTAVVLPELDSNAGRELSIESSSRVLGVTNSETGFVVSESATASVWIHEYVHTLQDFETTEDTIWLSEATAEYYEQLLGYKYGIIDESEIERRFHPDRNSTAVLANSSTWQSSHVPYTKGQRVVAYLDYRIRNTTNGNRSFRDVMVRLNEQSEPVTLASFQETVAYVVGTDTLDDDIEQFVCTKTSVDAGVRLAQLRANMSESQRSAPTTESTVSSDPAMSHLYDQFLESEWSWLTFPSR